MTRMIAAEHYLRPNVSEVMSSDFIYYNFKKNGERKSNNKFSQGVSSKVINNYVNNLWEQISDIEDQISKYNN